MVSKELHTQNIVACIWDFDKTLIPEYMQKPLFQAFDIDESVFWKEVNALPQRYAAKGIHVSKDTVYLNHLLSYIKNGPLKGLNNATLRELGQEIAFYPGLPEFFTKIKSAVREKPEYLQYDIKLEHYIISTGLAEMIRGSAIAPFVDGIFGCEFVEEPFPPGYLKQEEFALDGDQEIGQIGTMVDNTMKTRYIFEINKGSNKNPSIDVNASIREQDRRIPVSHMIYTADGPSDIPVFALLKKNGGKTYAVYNPQRPDEFAQNDDLLQCDRIHAYGPANYQEDSSTFMWLSMHIQKICDSIVKKQESAQANQIFSPPNHLHKKETPSSSSFEPKIQQKSFL